MSTAAMSQLFHRGQAWHFPNLANSLRPDYSLDSFNSLHIFKSTKTHLLGIIRWYIHINIIENLWKYLIHIYAEIIEAKHHEKSSMFFFTQFYQLIIVFFIQREFSQEVHPAFLFFRPFCYSRPIYIPKRKGLEAKLRAVSPHGDGLKNPDVWQYRLKKQFLSAWGIVFFFVVLFTVPMEDTVMCFFKDSCMKKCIRGILFPLMKSENSQQNDCEFRDEVVWLCTKAEVDLCKAEEWETKNSRNSVRLPKRAWQTR